MQPIVNNNLVASDLLLLANQQQNFLMYLQVTLLINLMFTIYDTF